MDVFKIVPFLFGQVLFDVFSSGTSKMSMLPDA